MEARSLCTQLADWLNAASWQEPAGIAALAAHIHACPSCRQGRIRLPEGFRVDNDLSHDQCQAHFPTYYEATRPEHPLATMAGSALVAVTLHMAGCAQCREVYEALCFIWELEERGEGNR